MIFDEKQLPLRRGGGEKEEEVSKKVKHPLKEGFWFNNLHSPTIFLPFVSDKFSVALRFIIIL